MKNDGSEYEEEFETTLNKRYAKKVFVIKYTDTKQVKGVSKTGFAKSAPADFIVTHNGEMYFAEVKSTCNTTSFSFSLFTKSQLIAMKRQLSAGGKYFVFICNTNNHVWYKVPATTISDVVQDGRNSMKWSELDANYRWNGE